MEIKLVNLEDKVVDRINEIWKRYLCLTPEKWGPVETDEEGREWIRIPHHDLFLGDLEDTDKCCYDIADFIIHSKEDISYLLGLIKELTYKGRWTF